MIAIEMTDKGYYYIHYPDVFKSSYNDTIRLNKDLYQRYKKLDRFLDLLYQKVEAFNDKGDYKKVEMEITSGFRTPKINALVGGAKNSQHPEFEAVDIKFFYSQSRDEAEAELYQDFARCITEEDTVLQLIVYNRKTDGKSLIHIGIVTNRALKAGVKYYRRGF